MRAVFVIILLSMLLTPLPTYADYSALFHSTETRSTNLKPFFKWTGMLDRFRKKHLSENGCKPTKTKKCYKKEWLGFLKTIEKKKLRNQIGDINKHMNEAEYILDIINWGVQDYWATPYQFFIKDGDCEDYAIAKYMSLKSLGFPPDKMRVVVLQDTNLGVIHAVLAVYVGNNIFVLDNQIDQVVSSEKIHHYVPIYSINESGWWRHRKN